MVSKECSENRQRLEPDPLEAPMSRDWTDVVTTRQRSKWPSAQFWIIFSLLRFILYTNPACVKGFVFHVHYYVMYRKWPWSKDEINKSKTSLLWQSFRAYEHNWLLQKRGFACGGVQPRIHSTVLILKTSCIWSHCAKTLFPLLVYLLHWDVYHIVCQNTKQFHES